MRGSAAERGAPSGQCREVEIRIWSRAEQGRADPDFQFPQDTTGRGGWSPRLSDYLYVSLTNASSFSTSEDMTPVTQKAKVLLSLQTLASLLTTTIVVAYAVNNLS